MRLKFSRKVIISSLSLLAGASVIGSITSTVAWFQYATKAQLAYTGTTTHCSKLLKVAVKNSRAPAWGNHLGMSDLPSDIEFAPITTGEQDKDADLPANFYAQPNPKQGAYTNWLTADAENYAQFTILVKVDDVNETTAQLKNDVYLTDVTIQDASSNGTLDLSNAIRVHIATTYKDSNSNTAHKYFLFSKQDASTDVGGYLDLDSDGEYDTTGYEWDSQKVIYGSATESGGVLTPATQEAYALNDANIGNIIATEANDGSISGGTAIGNTSATTGEYLEVKVTIWLEGWAMLKHGVANNIDSEDTQVWDSAKYTNKKFNVGLTFGVDLHSDADHA